MSTRTLSRDAQQAIEVAQQFAEVHHHDELDSSHLFYALAKQDEVVRGWISAAGYQDIDKLLQFIFSITFSV